MVTQSSIINLQHELVPVASSMQNLGPGAGVLSFSAFGSTVEYVLVTIATNWAWVTFDGTTPAVGTGHYYPDGDYLWSKAMAAAAKFIQDTGAQISVAGTGMKTSS